jgi:hypothetical protein
MDCRQASEALSEYIDGRLPVEDAAAVSAHLESCAVCRSLEGDLRRTVELVGGLEAKTPPADFADSIAARLERRMLLEEPAAAPRRRVIGWPATGLGLAAAAALVVAVYVRYAPEATSPAPADMTAEVADRRAAYAAKSSADAAAAPERRADAVAESAGPTRQENANGLDDALKAHETAYRLSESELQAGKPMAGAAPAPAKEEGLKALGYVGSVEREASASAGNEAAQTAAARGAGLDKDGEAATTLTFGPVTAEEAKGAGAVTAAEQAAPEHAVYARGIGERGKAETLVLRIATEGEALVVARKLLSLLPAGDAKPMPDGALTADAIRAAAAERNAEAVEVSADKVVIEAELDAGEARSIHAQLTPSRHTDALAQSTGRAAGGVPPAAAAEQSAISSVDAQDVVASMHKAPAEPPASMQAARVKARFVLERAVADMPAAEQP